MNKAILMLFASSVMIASAQAGDDGVYGVRIGADVPNTYDEFGFDRNGKDRDGNAANVAPVINSFTANAYTGLTPITISFLASVFDESGTPTLNIDYGDGNSGTSLSHEYTTVPSNPLTVVLTATDEHDSQLSDQQSLQLTLTLGSPPVIGTMELSPSFASWNFAGGKTDISMPLSDNTGVALLTVDWGDGSGIASYNFTAGKTNLPTYRKNHVYTASGNYTITATLKDWDNQETTAQLIQNVPSLNIASGCQYSTAFRGSMRGVPPNMSYYYNLGGSYETTMTNSSTHTFQHDVHGTITLTLGALQQEYTYGGGEIHNFYELCASW